MPDEPEKPDALEAFFRETVKAEDLPALLKQLHEESTEKIRGHNNAKTMGMRLEKRDFKKLVPDFKKKGISRVRKLNVGAFSAILRLPQHQVLRISSQEMEKRPYENWPPMLLKPLKSWNIGPYRVEVFPEVNTADVKDYHVEALENLAAACGYHFLDIASRNVGLLAGGVPVIIDPGALVEDKKLFDKQHQKARRTNNRVWADKLEMHRALIGEIHNFNKHKPAFWNHGPTFRRDYDSPELTADRKTNLFCKLYKKVFKTIKIDNSLYARIKEIFQHQEVIDTYLSHHHVTDIPEAYYLDPTRKPEEYICEDGHTLDDALTNAAELMEHIKRLRKDQTYLDAFKGKQSLLPDIRKDLEKLFSTAMQQHLDKHGLEYGRISGVFDEEAVKSYLQKTGRMDAEGNPVSGTTSPARLPEIAREYGVPKEILGDASLKAAQKMMGGAEPRDGDWRNLIADQLEEAEKKAKDGTPPK